ncbi:hypothetical protein Tco_0824977, partial [Tanacetum coccineum]
MVPLSATLKHFQVEALVEAVKRLGTGMYSSIDTILSLSPNLRGFEGQVENTRAHGKNITTLKESFDQIINKEIPAKISYEDDK